MRRDDDRREAVTYRVPAKVNLELRVGPLRSDGFHPLATVFHAIGIYDEVRASRTAANKVTVAVTGDTPGLAAVPQSEDNLAARAAQALARSAGCELGVHLQITKRIPVAGGLAGGSADAAGALLACRDLWRLGNSDDELRSIAAEVGSDVPFALLGGTAVGTGRGERLASLPEGGTFSWVVAVAERGLSTPAVYGELDRLRHGTAVPELRVTDSLVAAIRSGDPAGLAEAMANDMQAAALSLRPELAKTLDVGRQAGALVGLVSGSGPTCVFLVSDTAAAETVEAALRSRAVAHEVLRATSPAHTASVPD